MFHWGTELVRPGEGNEEKLNTAWQFHGKDASTAIFGKYIAPGGLLSHQAVIGIEDANSP